MCTVICDGSCRTSVPSFAGELTVEAGSGLLRFGARAVGGLAIVAGVGAVLGVRWLTATRKRSTGATWLRGAVPSRRVSLRHPQWAYWPGWQLAIVRCVLVGLVACGLLWPLVTTVAVTSVLVAFVVTVGVAKRHVVQQVVARTRVACRLERPALTAGSDLDREPYRAIQGDIPTGQHVDDLRPDREPVKVGAHQWRAVVDIGDHRGGEGPSC